MEVDWIVLQFGCGQPRVITSLIFVTRNSGGVLHWNDVSFNKMKSIIISIRWPLFLPRFSLGKATINTLMTVDYLAPSPSWEEVAGSIHSSCC